MVIVYFMREPESQTLDGAQQSTVFKRRGEVIDHKKRMELGLQGKETAMAEVNLRPICAKPNSSNAREQLPKLS